MAIWLLRKPVTGPARQPEAKHQGTWRVSQGWMVGTIEEEQGPEEGWVGRTKRDWLVLRVKLLDPATTNDMPRVCGKNLTFSLLL